MLKYILRDDLEKALKRILPLLIEVQEKRTGLEYIEIVLRYLTTGTDKVSRTTLNKLLKDVFVQGEKLMPTIAEEWINEGRKIGLKEGIEQGKYKATLNSTKHSLSIRFSIILQDLDEPLTGVSLETLEKISELALTAETRSEFKANLNQIISDEQKKTDDD